MGRKDTGKETGNAQRDDRARVEKQKVENIAGKAEKMHGKVEKTVGKGGKDAGKKGKGGKRKEAYSHQYSGEWERSAAKVRVFLDFH